jgi:hypothetical protein
VCNSGELASMIDTNLINITEAAITSVSLNAIEPINSIPRSCRCLCAPKSITGASLYSNIADLNIFQL